MTTITNALNVVSQHVDLGVLSAFAVVVALVAYLRFVAPKIQRKKELYQEVTLVLSVVGAVYKDEDVKEATKFVKELVEYLQDMEQEPTKEEVFTATNHMLDRMNVEISEEALDLVVNTVLYYLG